MHGIWTDFLDLIAQLSWFDYFAVITLLVSAWVGFQRGFALTLIRLIWYIAGFIIAALSYTSLANTTWLDWLSGNVWLNSFVLIFLVFLASKLLIYKLLEKIAALHGPCPVNRFLAIVIGIGLALGVSWLAADKVSQIEIFYQLVNNSVVRFSVVYTVTFSLILIASFVLIKMLNVKVGMDRPCPLLLALKPLDSILNAKNINSKTNHFFGLFAGALMGLIVLLLLMMMFNHLQITTSGHWTGDLTQMANNTQSVLAQYLNFIEKP